MKQFELKLTEAELNTVLQALYQMPYLQVYQLIPTIVQQSQAQATAKE